MAEKDGPARLPRKAVLVSVKLKVVRLDIDGRSCVRPQDAEVALHESVGWRVGHHIAGCVAIVRNHDERGWVTHRNSG